MFGREAHAWAKQGQLIMMDAARPRVAPRAPIPAGSDRVIAFVHGFGAAGAVFDPLRRRVEARLPVSTVDFTYGSHWPFSRVTEAFARELEPLVRAGRPVDLVGHSLGGLVARWYLQEMGGAEHVGRLVTIATPHAGTRSAHIAPGPLRAALLPGGAIVRRLASGRGRASGVEHTALVAGEDLMVTPLASAAALEDAEVCWFADVGHNAMLYAPEVHAAVLHALGQPAATPELVTAAGFAPTPVAPDDRDL